MPDHSNLVLGRSLSVAFVSTCPPRQCGIATFASDLERALKAADESVLIQWAAINEATSIHTYGPEVHWRIRQGDPDSYLAAAEHLNVAAVDVVSLQHEFGLYGTWGDPFEDHLVSFLDVLEKPLVTTLHSVLPDPSPSIRAAVHRIVQRSNLVVVMAERARSLLIQDYGVAERQVCVVPHGVPPGQPHGRTRIKEQFDLTGRTIITSFGLIDPRKGLEHMIEAMQVVRRYDPSALYLVVGETHTELVRREGEAWRRQLWQLVKDRDSSNTLSSWTSLSPRRRSSTTCLSATCASCRTSTPNRLRVAHWRMRSGPAWRSSRRRTRTRREVLTAARGILVPFRSQSALAEATLRILAHPERMLAILRSATLQSEAGANHRRLLTSASAV